MTELHKGLPVLAFPDQPAFEAWLAAQPPGQPGLWLKLAKKGAGVPSVTHSEMVDACLAHGWIDGLINSLDERAYLVRVTPRKPRSKWSEVNVRRAEALIAAGRMAAGGQAEVDRARADGRWAAPIRPPAGPRSRPTSGPPSTPTPPRPPPGPRSTAPIATPSFTGCMTPSPTLAPASSTASSACWPKAAASTTDSRPGSGKSRSHQRLGRAPTSPRPEPSHDDALEAAASRA